MATAAATGAGIALPLFGAFTAQAAEPGTWDRVAFCESGGMWHANTGNGFYGGLAITQETWDQFGGDKFAKRPDLATQRAQIAVAEKMLTDLGPNAWPGCEQGTGLLDDGSTGDPGATDPTPAQPGEHSPGSRTPSDAPTSPTSDPTSPVTPGAPTTNPGGSDTGTPPATPGDPTATDPTATDPMDTAPPTTDPTSPATPTTPTTGTPGDPTTGPGTDPTTPPVTPPVTPVTPAPPTQGTGSSTLAPTDPSDPSATPPAAPGTGSGPGRHAKPYSPTDEELAAQDQATRTQVYSQTDDKAPGKHTSTDTANKSDDPGTSAASRYTVGTGDSLSGIATTQHVDGGWRHLYDVNHQLIGDDPNLIKPGQTINLG